MSFRILIVFTLTVELVYTRNILENESHDLNRELAGISGETELLIQPLGSNSDLKWMQNTGHDHEKTETIVKTSFRLLDIVRHEVVTSLNQLDTLLRSMVRSSLRVAAATG